MLPCGIFTDDEGRCSQCAYTSCILWYLFLRVIILKFDSTIRRSNNLYKTKERCADERFLVDVSSHHYFMALRCMNVLKNRRALSFFDGSLRALRMGVSCTLGNAPGSW